MNKEAGEFQISNQTLAQISANGICYDPENIVIYGWYPDELSAFRAKKVWRLTLEENFLLEEEHDFTQKVLTNGELLRYGVECSFKTACARYAFWRITNNQAPEAQYMLETAHIPASIFNHDDILTAPDLRSIHDEPIILSGSNGLKRNLDGWSLKSFLQRILNI